MRATPPPVTRLQYVVRAAIFVGLLAVSMLAMRALVEGVLDDELATARRDRLCLIEALLAVRDALQGVEVPGGLPPSCAAILNDLPPVAPVQP